MCTVRREPAFQASMFSDLDGIDRVEFNVNIRESYPVFRSAIVDTGIWLLRCRSCKNTFDLEITDQNDAVLNLIKVTRCPHCNQSPAHDGDGGQPPRWHEIVNYRFPRRAD